MAVVFVLVALHLFAVGPDGRADPDSFLTVWIGPIAISLLALLADWIAFGPGERRGSSTLSLLFFSSGRSAGGTETRIVFGLAGVFFTALAVYAIRGTLLDRRTKRLRERALRRREAARHAPGGGPP